MDYWSKYFWISPSCTSSLFPISTRRAASCSNCELCSNFIQEVPGTACHVRTNLLSSRFSQARFDSWYDCESHKTIYMFLCWFRLSVPYFSFLPLNVKARWVLKCSYAFFSDACMNVYIFLANLHFQASLHKLAVKINKLRTIKP